MAQFEKVNARYGAPMGRADTGATPVQKVRVFRVNLDSGGYDDGGAYWGAGAPLWCATDGADYRRFVRADSRLRVCAELRLHCDELAKPPKGDYLRLDYFIRCGTVGASSAALRETLDSLGFDRYDIATELRAGFKP